MGKIARNGNIYGGGNLTHTTEEVTKVTHGDWNINDSANEHYIENRPFYETDVVIPSYTYEDLVEFVKPDPFVPLVEGQSYKVIYDGQEYTCEAKVAVMISASGGLGLGNLGLMHYYNGTTGEEYPFAIGYDYDYYHFLCNDASEHTIEVRSIGEENKIIKKIDKKFIPEINIPHVDGAGYHNSIYRGKDLGTAVTDEQKAAIKSGTFEDLFIGDYWKINGVKYIIAAFDYYLNKYTQYYDILEGTRTGILQDHHITIVFVEDYYRSFNNTVDYTYQYCGYADSTLFQDLADEDNAPLSTVVEAFGSLDDVPSIQLELTSGELTESSTIDDINVVYKYVRLRPICEQNMYTSRKRYGGFTNGYKEITCDIGPYPVFQLGNPASVLNVKYVSVHTRDLYSYNKNLVTASTRHAMTTQDVTSSDQSALVFEYAPK